jgi:ketosteroid isomerase-like protein
MKTQLLFCRKIDVATNRVMGQSYSLPKATDYWPSTVIFIFGIKMIRPDPRSVVNVMYAALLARNVPDVLAVCDNIVRISQHYSDPKLPFTGTTVGHAAYAARLALIFADWTFERGDHTFTYSDAVNVRSRVDVAIRHKASQRLFEGHFRHIFVVRNGLITQLEEYVDLPRLQAFLRLL